MIWSSVFERYELVETTLKILGAAYLSYLAWKIFNAGKVQTADTTAAKPFTFLQAAAFQWVNPKAWVRGTAATSTLLPDDVSVLGGAISLAGWFWIVNLPCIVAWLLTGAYASRWVENQDRMQLINRTLGVLLGATVVLLLL